MEASWSEEEQQRLEEGLARSAAICNPRDKWEAIAAIVGTRDAKACAERFQACRAEALRSSAPAASRRGNRDGKGGSRSEEEDDEDDEVGDDDGTGEEDAEAEHGDSGAPSNRHGSSWSTWSGNWWKGGWRGRRGGSWWESSRSGWDEGKSWEDSAGGSKWWESKDEGENWNHEAEAPDAQEEEPMDESQRRALEARREVEANRERMRLKQEREEEERKRRDAKKAAEEEKKAQERREYAQEQQRKYEEKLEQQRKKQAEQEALLQRVEKQMEGAVNVGFTPAKAKAAPPPTKSEEVAVKLGGWAAKAKAAQRGQLMKQKKQEELERQAAEVMAAIAEATKGKKAGAKTPAVSEEPKANSTGSKATDASERSTAASPVAEDDPSGGAAASGSATTGRRATQRAPIGPSRAPIGPAAAGHAAGAEQAEASGEEGPTASSNGNHSGAEDGTGKGKGKGKGKGAEKGKGGKASKAALEGQTRSEAEGAKGSAGGKQKRQQPPKKRWWSKLDGDCPISLAPLGELLAPPFGLDAEGSANKHYFDARFLASFLLSSCDFIDPVNRRPLTLQECEALDAHLLHNHPEERGDASVADAFQLFQRHGSGGGSGDTSMHAVQREATSVLQHLFRFRSARRTDQRGRAIAHAEGGLTVVDDDDILTAGAPRPQQREVAPAEATAEDFPGLPGDRRSEAAAGGWRGRNGGGGPEVSREEAYPSLPAAAKAKAKATSGPAAGGRTSSGRGGGGRGSGNKFLNPGRGRGWGPAR